MKRMGLAELLHPLSVERFLSNYWQKKPYVSHGSLGRFEDLAQIPEFESIEILLEAWKGQADAWAPRDKKLPVIAAEPHQLSAFYESGYTLYLSRVEEYVPSLEPLARQLELDLGLRFGEVYFEGFISQGTGSAFHFDPNVTINIQLIGSKFWQVAENKHIVNPHMGWSVNTEVPELMQEYARQPFPMAMPRGARSFEARAGTLVYLHPGYWHCTYNHEPSLSLLYTVNPPSWAELLAEEIKIQLQMTEEGRELAFGLGSNGIFLAENRRRLEILLQEIGKAAERSGADQLLANWGDSLTAKFEKNSNVVYQTEMVERWGKNRCLLSMGNGRKREKIELPSEAAAILKWVSARRRPFAGRDAAMAIDRADPELVVDILGELVTAGLITKRN